MTSPDQRLRSPARALLVIDQPVLAEVVQLALGHGHYSTRIVHAYHEVTTALLEWGPQLIVIDMDTEDRGMLERLGHATNPSHVPVIALTRRGGLHAKLTASEQGADDTLPVPASPEEFVSRVLAIMRRTYRDAVAFTPVLRLGD